MIYKLRLNDLKEAFTQWKSKPEPSLLEGALLVTQFQYPELAIDTLRHQLEKIRRNIWLELNNYLTPLEQANVIRNILYNYYQIKGVEINYEKPVEFLMTGPLQKKETHLPTLFISELCSQLEIDAQFINIPSNVLLLFMLPIGMTTEVYPTHKNTFNLCRRYHGSCIFTKGFRSVFF